MAGSQMEIDVDELIQLAKHACCHQPKRYVQQISYKSHLFWVKQRPYSKQTFWHYGQNYLARACRLPMFATTASTGGALSLQFEAKRLTEFAHHRLNVPKVWVVTDTFIILADVGMRFDKWLRLQSKINVVQWLHQAMQALCDIHHHNLCHGRPALRDMTVLNNTIFWLDLEENPLKHMNLAQAQARDIWLFMASAAAWLDDSELIKLADIWRHNAAEATLFAMKAWVKTIKPLRLITQWLPKMYLGRDVLNARIANKALEHLLLND